MVGASDAAAAQLAARMPQDFIFGTATSSWQIEGSSATRGRSIWDDFAAVQGNIIDGTQADPACDHINRWRDDLDTLAWLGVAAYRFSFSWPRLLPDGKGAINKSGLDFYDRLIDGLLERGIKPVATMYHWDLPSKLQSDGGWASAHIYGAFTEYAELLASHFADRVDRWATLNEPWVSAYLGYATKIHAPGLGDPAKGLEVAYRLLVAHARALEVLRKHKAKNCGIVLNLSPVIAEDDGVAHAAAHMDGLLSRFWLDLLAGRGIPSDLIAGTASISDWSFVDGDDLKSISAPIDWLGINYYFPTRIASQSGQEMGKIVGNNNEVFPGTPPVEFVPREPRTLMGWEIDAPSLTTTVEMTSERLPGVPLFITENGGAFDDHLIDGKVNDVDRCDYYRAHISATLDCVERGLPVRGYFAWSLFDNIEWAEGWTKRFGLIYVDPETQVRTPKASAYFIRDILAKRRTPQSKKPD